MDERLAMLIIMTYTADKHRQHIMKMWEFLGYNHRDAYHGYIESDFSGKMLTGHEDIWRSLYFTNREIRDKYMYEIPERFAMGDALNVAYQYMKENF